MSAELERIGAEALYELPCKCGHKQRQHDPEDGRCDSAAVNQLGQCHCKAFCTPTPNLTTSEYRSRAVLDALAREGYSIGKWEQVGWRLPGGELVTEFSRAVVRDFGGPFSAPVFRRVDTEET